MSNQDLVARAQAVLFQNYRTQPIALVRGEGTQVWDADGKRYLDFIGGIATVSVGHANPRVREALIEQSRLLWHASNLYVTEPQVRLAELLTAQSKTLKRAFFCNSGTEANEGMIKLARHFHVVNGAPERVEIICFNNSFHGRTMGSLAATGQPKYQQGFGPLPGGFRFLDYGDEQQLREAVSSKTCAVLLEPVQGEAGVMLPPRGYLKLVRELCDKHGALMLLDEVQTGMGRTGAYFAHQHERIEPDAITLAKGIAGGAPLGALLARENLAKVFTPGTHASTFGGNPLTTAAACAVMELLRAGLLERVQQAGERLSQRLAAIPHTAGERGLGLLRALLLSDDSATKVVGRARDMGLLVNSIGDRVVRLAPPLTVSDEEIDQAAEMLARAVGER
jgi:predicted acetylornithine/succinylornithine family transaminase